MQKKDLAHEIAFAIGHIENAFATKKILIFNRFQNVIHKDEYELTQMFCETRYSSRS